MKTFINVLLVAGLIVFVACGGGEKAPKKEQKNQTAKTGQAASSGLTEFQLQNGIGPITSKLQIGEIDPAKVKAGEATYKAKCTPCHRLDKRLVGPALRYVTLRRSPEYIMNMVLNPTGMVKEHPEAKKVLAEYLSPMTDMHLTVDQARELVDYLRNAAKEGKEKNIPEVPLFKSQQQ